MNIAVTLATDLNKRVLVIDGDLRRGERMVPVAEVHPPQDVVVVRDVEGLALDG